MTDKNLHRVLLIMVLGFFAWSAIDVQDTYLTWFLETVPVMIILPVVIATYKRFPLSNLLYILLALQAMILMYGGHYSYSETPLGFWMPDWFGWTRNNYDKIGHLMQGIGPAIITREILIRTSPVKKGNWLVLFAIAIPLAFSALYEIIEWAASLTNPRETEAFLGTQGYIWDTQTDMFLCLIGSIMAVLLLSKVHDKGLKFLNNDQDQTTQILTK